MSQLFGAPVPVGIPELRVGRLHAEGVRRSASSARKTEGIIFDFNLILHTQSSFNYRQGSV